MSDELPTTDPYVGTAELGGKVASYKCESCKSLVWDDDVSDALAEAVEENTTMAVERAVDGAECPGCGHTQNTTSAYKC